MNKINTKLDRNIIEIDENLCDGCGLCLHGCAEGALSIVNGKAKLVSDVYCDGLGSCLAECPTGALKIIQRKAYEFNEEVAMARVKKMASEAQAQCACPGSKTMNLKPQEPLLAKITEEHAAAGLAYWPIQLKLASVENTAFDNPVLVLASDCSGFIGPQFHQTFLNQGQPLLIACPKLDDSEAYIEKMADILRKHPNIKELQVPMMSVPCCGGLAYIATQALKKAKREDDIILRTWIISPQGQISEESIR